MKHLSLFFVIFFLLVGSQAMAHNVWINPGNHFPKVGDMVDIEIGWGHKYPANRVDQTMKEGNMAYMKAFDPDGTEVTPTAVSETHYTLPVTKPGAYLLIAGIKPGVFTKTPEGRKWSDKRGVDQPIACTSYSIDAKSVILAGNSMAGEGHSCGQALEIIPVTDFSSLKPGQTVSLKVLFKGEPATDVALNATYAGFEPEGPRGHGEKTGPPEKGKGRKPVYPASGVTDKDGIATIIPDRSGYWMVMVSHKTPYPDTTVCDQYMHNMAFTFQVK